MCLQIIFENKFLLVKIKKKKSQVSIQKQFLKLILNYFQKQKLDKQIYVIIRFWWWVARKSELGTEILEIQKRRGELGIDDRTSTSWEVE